MKIPLVGWFILNALLVGVFFSILDAIFGQKPIGIETILIVGFVFTWASHEEKKANLNNPRPE